MLRLFFVIGCLLLVHANVERTLDFKIKGPKSFDDKIAIIGAGPSGIHMAYLLKQNGFTNIHILERSSSIGGKIHTVYHRNSPLDVGAIVFVQTSPHIHELVTKFLPNDVQVTNPNPTIWFHGKQMQDLEFIIYYVRNVLGMYHHLDDKQILMELVKAEEKYDRLFNDIFGKFKGSVPPRPKNFELIKGTIKDFLVRNNLAVLIPQFILSMQMYGYSYIEQIPAFYGLLWISTHAYHPFGSKAQNGEVYIFKHGYQKLWQTIVEREQLHVTFNVDIQNVYRMYDSYDDAHSKVKIYMARNNGPHKEEVFDFLIWSPEMKTSMKQWENNIAEERDLLSRTIPTFYTVSIVDSKDEKRGLYPTNMFPANMVQSGDGKVHLAIDMYSTVHYYEGPKYQSRQYPMGVDGKKITSYITYQQSMSKLPDKETKRLLVENFQNRSASSVKVIYSKTWRYFPRYSIDNIENGVTWKIIEMQGKYGMWYIGSSVFFESVHHVTSYNALIVENMRMPTISRLQRKWESVFRP